MKAVGEVAPTEDFRQQYSLVVRELELKRQSLIRQLIHSDDKSGVQRLLQQKKSIKHRFEAFDDINRVISNLT